MLLCHSWQLIQTGDDDRFKSEGLARSLSPVRYIDALEGQPGSPVLLGTMSNTRPGELGRRKLSHARRTSPTGPRGIRI